MTVVGFDAGPRQEIVAARTAQSRGADLSTLLIWANHRDRPEFASPPPGQWSSLPRSDSFNAL